MLSHLFLGMSLVGAEWVLYLLVLLSVLSVTLILERMRFYRSASRGLSSFRSQIREQALAGRWDEATRLAADRMSQTADGTPDLEAQMAHALLAQRGKATTPDVLGEVAQDPVMRGRLHWERNLAVLATIGSNAPFIGLFGTVLGIIKAFHDLSQQAATGAAGVTSGISEALVATAVGLLVAIPAVIAFNVFQRKVKSALGEAEALKSFLIGKLSQ
jgi:biopolymer transport protein ExbB